MWHGQKCLVGKPEREHLGLSERKREDNIKIDLKLTE